jgi:hypothetical protein
MGNELILPLAIEIADALDAMEFLDGASGFLPRTCSVLATGPSIVPGSGQVFLVNQSRLCFHDFCIAGTGGNYDFYQPKIKNLGAPRLVTRMFAGLIKSTLPEPGSC